jgi:predicted transcriptional regulator
MGLFFFKKEIEREQFAQRLDSLESQIEKIANVLARHAEKITSPHSELNEMIEKSKLHDELLMHQSRMINSMQEKIDSLEYELTRKIGNEVAKQIQSAKAVDKAHETNPSLAKRMNEKRTRRVGTYAEKQYNEPYRIAWIMKKEGYSRLQIANALNAKGFLTPHLNKFTVHSVSDIMENQHQKDQWKYDQAKQAKQIAIQTDSQRNFLNGIM